MLKYLLILLIVDIRNTLYNLYIASPLKIYAPVNSTALLYSFTNVVAINFNDHFDTSKVENMKFMF